MIGLVAILGVFAALDASPSPVPSPTPTPRFEVHGLLSNVYIDQALSGPGQQPIEGPAFINGAPAAPMTPFDWFVTTPLLPGSSAQLQYSLTATVHGSKLSADATILSSAIFGDVYNGLYWGEPLVGTFDPHEGNSQLPYAVIYPPGPGTIDTSGAAINAPYEVTLRANDQSFKIGAGFVQTSQYDGFTFTQPATPSWTPTMNLQTFESLGPGLADLDAWHHFATALPLRGLDASAKIGGASIEATDGLLPSPNTTLAHMTAGNVVFDRGDSGRYSLDYVHVQTSGDPIEIPSFFGSNPTVNPGAQGKLALSTLGNQQQSILGGRAFFHPHKGYDATLELGRAWYSADMADRPGTSAPGNYQHYSLLRHFNQSDDLGIEFYSMEPRYGTMVLPYGIFENVWGIAWAYPGPWLKGTYQLTNGSFGGSNRRGLRAHADMKRGAWSAALAAYDYRQIEPSTWDNLTRTGFVEVDYLVLNPGDLTLGHTRGLGAYLAYQHAKDTASLDFSNDAQHRDYAGAASALDGVEMRYPQLVLAEEHRFGDRFIANAGYERYHAAGTWTTTAVKGTFEAGWLGGEIDFGRAGQLFVQLRRYSTVGIPSTPGGPPPTLSGTQLVVDHHFIF